MKYKLASFFLYCFIAAAIANTVAAAGNYTFDGVVKPMLMPLLIMALLSNKTSNASLIITGLFFSWAGDVLLLFESKNALFFISGLVCFLITHICYIIYFLKIKSSAASLLRNQPWLAALVAAYGVGLVQFLYPHLGEMTIPVLVYAVVICTMMLCSLHVFTKVSRPANGLFVAGALLFAASDSLLAVNKFFKPFEFATALIISTYCVAQLLIVMGVVKVRH